MVFIDQTIIQNKPNLIRAWYDKDENPISLTNWNNKREIVFGAWSVDDSFSYSVFDKTNSENVIEFIKKLKEHHREFVLVMDNAPWHRSKKTKRFLNENGIIVLKLPKYSPEENPVEQFWRVLKMNLANRLFESNEEFGNAVIEGLENLKVNIDMYHYLC